MIAADEALDGTWPYPARSPFPTPAQCRGVIAFPRQVLEGPPGPPPMEAVAALRGLPAMLAVGMRDTALLPEYVNKMLAIADTDAALQGIAEVSPQGATG